MKTFLDTSSLLKLYHKEADATDFKSMFAALKITKIFLSEIAKIEFASAIWKKVRLKEIEQTKAQRILELFSSDLEKYNFVPIEDRIIEQAKFLVSKYGLQGLRTLDSLQLASSVSLRNQVDLFISSDKLLKSLFEAEGLPTQLPRY